MGESGSNDSRSAVASDAGAVSRLYARAKARPFLTVALAAVAATLLVAVMVGALYVIVGPTASESAVSTGVSAPAQAEEARSTPARIELAADSIELGNIPQGEEAEFLLEITNPGGEPLVIREVRSS